MLRLWTNIRMGREPSALNDQEVSERRHRLWQATDETSLKMLGNRAEEYLVRGGALTCLDVCHALEQSTPLLLLHLIIRKGSRNRLSSGLQQTYGDHTRMLAYSIDRLAGGDVAWLMDRVWKNVAVSEQTIIRCANAFQALSFDRRHQLTLWFSASLHDYGKLFGRRDGLDPEDGITLVEQLLSRVPLLQDMLPLILFAVRNHDVIESVTTGETPASFIREQVEALQVNQQRLAVALLGVIQLAGAASLGMGRIVPSKISIYQRCLDGSITHAVSAADRAVALCSVVERGDHYFATVIAGDRVLSAIADETRDLLERVVLHGWHQVRDAAWSSERSGDEAFLVLGEVLEKLAGMVASGPATIRHLVIKEAAVPELMRGTGPTYSGSVAIGYGRTLNGERYIAVG